MNQPCLRFCLWVGVIGLLAACGPSPAQRAALGTQLAASIFATETAQAPTATTQPSATPTAPPTFTASPRPTATFTPTPTPKPSSTPTATPVPTNTPLPTGTPWPTVTPYPLAADWHDYAVSDFYIALPRRWKTVNIDQDGYEAIAAALKNIDTKWAKFASQSMANSSNLYKFWAMDTKAAGSGFPTAAVMSQRQLTELAAEEYATALKNLFKQTGVETLATKTNLSINGLDTARLTLRLKTDILTVKEDVYVFVQGRRAWILFFAVDETAWAKYQPTFAAVASTFRAGPESAAEPTTSAARTYYDQGVNAAQQGEYQSAITAFDKAIQSQPDFSGAYLYRGWVYAQQQDYTRALADYAEAIRLAPNDASAYDAYIRRGWVYYLEHDYTHALADYAEAIRLAPAEAEPYIERGWIYYKQHSYSLALADYTEAIRLAPDDSQAYRERGWVYADQHNYPLAIADYTQAIRLAPDDALTYLERGRAYKDLGQKSKAVADLQKVLELSSDPQLVQEANDLLDALKPSTSTSPNGTLKVTIRAPWSQPNSVSAQVSLNRLGAVAGAPTGLRRSTG